MKKIIALFTFLLIPGLLLIIPVAQAHHSFSQFDRNVQRVVSGEVDRWVFNNPHVWIHMTEDGTNEQWSFEGAGLIPLLKKGIDGNTFRPGDQIVLMYCPLRDGRSGGAIGWIIKNNEPMIAPNDGGCWVTEDMKTQWLDWLEQGFTSNLEAEAA